MEWLALGAAAFLLLRKPAPSDGQQQAPAPAPSGKGKPSPGSAVDAGAIAKVAVAIAPAAKGLGAAGAAAIGAIGGAIVPLLWGVLFVVSQVVSRVIEPEINRRRTIPAWLTEEPWGFAWRASREFWVATLERQLPTLRRVTARWVPGDGRYGDLNLMGELVYLTQPGETPPAEYHDFYAWLEWGRKARLVSPSLAAIEDGAHFLAYTFGMAFQVASRAAANISGQSTGVVKILASLAAEGTTPLGSGRQEVPLFGLKNVGAGDSEAAVLGGISAGIGIARASYTEGGRWLFDDVSRSALAADIVGRARAAGWSFVTADGGDIVCGAGRVTMPGGLP
jgi:PPE-repeat protein